MSWTKNEIILNQRPTMASSDLFQAVCDELGNYYSDKGFKYSRSRPKIVYKDKELKLEICFWSSRSNTAGQHVTLEIIPSFYSNEIIKNGTSTISSKIAKGLLVSKTALFMHNHNEGDNIQRLKQIYGETLLQEDGVYGGNIIRYNSTCNIYGIDEVKFKAIVGFIDTNILPWIDKLKTEEGILELINDRPKGVYSSLLGEGSNSDFLAYCELKFPELKVEELLNQLKNSQQMLP